MMSRDLGIVANKPARFHDLILKRWENIARDNNRVRAAIENENLNMELILKGRGSDEMKEKWAKLLRYEN